MSTRRLAVGRAAVLPACAFDFLREGEHSPAGSGGWLWWLR